MSYIINLPNGSLLTTILDGTIDNTASSLTLVGRNYSGYGQIIATDLVALLVNFSNNVSPASPLQGQIWYDSGNNVCKVYTGSIWKNIGAATVAPPTSIPSTTIAGDFWWDSQNKQLYCYDATLGWTLVGPGYSYVSGKSGAITEQLSDGTVWHDVVSLYLDGNRTAIISQNQFTPNVSITGFSGQLQVGYNMSSSGTQGYIWGTANNSSYLGGQPAANYFTNYQNNIGTGSLTLQSNAGVTLGTLGTLVANVTSSGTGRLYNTYLGGNVSFHVNSTLNGQEKSLWVNGYDGYVYVNSDPIGLMGVTTKQYVDGNIVLKANIASPTLTGTPAAPTPTAGDNSTTIATTAFVQGANLALKGYVDFANTIQSQQTSLRANIASPTFTGTPQAPTPLVGDNSANVATTGFVYQANVGMQGYVISKFNDTILYGSPTAPTAPVGTANSMVATTAFVVNNSGLFPYKIYQQNSWMWINDTGVGSANLVLDGTTVLTATSSGVVLASGATATTQSQTYNGSGDSTVATTQYVKSATNWWGGSAKWVSTDAPNPGVNDVGSNDGDIWFQYTN